MNYVAEVPALLVHSGRKSVEHLGRKWVVHYRAKLDNSYDATGNLTLENLAGTLTSYQYDDENRLTGIQFPAGTLLSIFAR